MKLKLLFLCFYTFFFLQILAMQEEHQASLTLQKKEEALRLIQQALDNEKHPSFRKFNVVEHGLNWKSEKGNTVLHAAVLHKAFTCIKLLLENGIDINVQNNDGMTPLFTASYLYYTENIQDYYQIAELLICYGADPDLRDYSANLQPRDIMLCALGRNRGKESRNQFIELLKACVGPKSR